MLVEPSQTLGLYTDTQVKSGVQELFDYEKFVVGGKNESAKVINRVLKSREKICS